MDIVKSIEHLHPTLVFWDDFIVSNDSQWWPDLIEWITTEYTQPTQAELDTAWAELEIIQQAEQTKIEKKMAIAKVASLSDQLNLIASVLDTLTSEAPDPTIIAWAKAKFSEIKTILDK